MPAQAHCKPCLTCPQGQRRARGQVPRRPGPCSRARGWPDQHALSARTRQRLGDRRRDVAAAAGLHHSVGGPPGHGHLAGACDPACMQPAGRKRHHQQRDEPPWWWPTPAQHCAPPHGRGGSSPMDCTSSQVAGLAVAVSAPAAPLGQGGAVSRPLNGEVPMAREGGRGWVWNEVCESGVGSWCRNCLLLAAFLGPCVRPFLPHALRGRMGPSKCEGRGEIVSGRCVISSPSYRPVSLFSLYFTCPGKYPVRLQ